MKCYLCDQPAQSVCQRCGYGYCPSHGRELCQRCLDSQGGVPSTAVYPGSLVALVAATLLTLWLLVSPPRLPSESSSSASASRPARAVVGAAPTPAPPAPSPVSGSPPTPTPSPTVTSLPPSTPTPTPASTPSPFLKYRVQEGDTIYDIAERFGVLAEDIVRLNSLNDPDQLLPGQELLIPR